ncbi:Protein OVEREXPRESSOR OF CATIONIC PEROXIDASE 3 [Nymphaea thermarum]|nr:Protein OVEREXPRESSOR OF CATIONIC PEROXIDASE 3 [Nymphaea thermarum]
MWAARPPSCSFSPFMGTTAKPVLSSPSSCPPFLSTSSFSFLGRCGIASSTGRNLPPNFVALTRPTLSQSRFRLCFSRRKSAGVPRQTRRNRKACTSPRLHYLFSIGFPLAALVAGEARFSPNSLHNSEATTERLYNKDVDENSTIVEGKIVRDSRDNEDPGEGGLEADEDALEALFSMLEEDLKNDDLALDNDDEEITEEDLAKLEQELEDALNDVEDDEVSLLQNEEGGSDEADEEEVEPVKLKRWQLRRLASALKVGRRKTNIKSLAAELGLERAVVLELLRDPPPDLLLLSASLPDKVIQPPIEVEPERKPIETAPTEAETESDDSLVAEIEKPAGKGKEPIHVLRNRWSGQKRLKKVQIETMERVYARSKRPTNAMVSSIVHVTNLPWKSVLKWFEDRRALDGVPDRRAPFQHETIS